MELKKTYEALNEEILCEYKSSLDLEQFFHSHDGYEILLLLDGEINYFTESEGICMKRGHLVFINPYIHHRREVVNIYKYERILININYYTLKRLSTIKTDLSECFSSMSGDLDIIYLDEYEIVKFVDIAINLRNCLHSNDYGRDVLIDSYVQQVLVMVNQKVKGANSLRVINNIMPPLVAETIAYIEQHIVEDITLESISSHLYHNGIYISRCFKKITGITLQQYIINKRITLAKKYLREGYAPCDSCFMSGFNDYSNFSRTFAKQVGVSPKKYQIIKK